MQGKPIYEHLTNRRLHRPVFMLSEYPLQHQGIKRLSGAYNGLKRGYQMCNHKYVDMEDGTRDKFCVRCSNKFKQAAIQIPEIKVEINFTNNNDIYASKVWGQLKNASQRMRYQ